MNDDGPTIQRQGECLHVLKPRLALARVRTVRLPIGVGLRGLKCADVSRREAGFTARDARRRTEVTFAVLCHRGDLAVLVFSPPVPFLRIKHGSISCAEYNEKGERRWVNTLARRRLLDSVLVMSQEDAGPHQRDGHNYEKEEEATRDGSGAEQETNVMAKQITYGEQSRQDSPCCLCSRRTI